MECGYGVEKQNSEEKKRNDLDPKQARKKTLVNNRYKAPVKNKKRTDNGEKGREIA